MPKHIISLFMALSLFAVGARADARIETSAGTMQIDLMVDGLDEPWAIEFLPDDGLIITERDGRLLIVQQGQRQSVAGLPEVYASGQGGLLDVLIPRDFEQSRRVWLSYAAPINGGAATAAGFGRLSSDGSRLEDFQTIFVGDPARGGRHFGSRLVEDKDGSIFLTTGDRGTGPEGLHAQDITSSLGKVIRLSANGAGTWQSKLVSTGHRNSQGATLSAQGRLYAVEHGAQGGDEVNAIFSDRNYGWPVISYGVNYGGAKIGEGTAGDGMEQPLHYWDPSIAPSGLMIYSGKMIPEWKGDFFFGSLNSDFLGRLDPDTAGPGGWAEERIQSQETGRVRDVVEAPDGAIWFLSVLEGAAYRMTPAN